MTTQKAPSPAAPAAASVAPAASPASSRKAWVPKTPVEIVLEQIGKQEKKVADMRTELAQEEKALGKLLTAKKALEAE